MSRRHGSRHTAPQITQREADTLVRSYWKIYKIWRRVLNTSLQIAMAQIFWALYKANRLPLGGSGRENWTLEIPPEWIFALHLVPNTPDWTLNAFVFNELPDLYQEEFVELRDKHRYYPFADATVKEMLDVKFDWTDGGMNRLIPYYLRR
jgi:hypothetical protein